MQQPIFGNKEVKKYLQAYIHICCKHQESAYNQLYASHLLIPELIRRQKGFGTMGSNINSGWNSCSFNYFDLPKKAHLCQMFSLKVLTFLFNLEKNEGKVFFQYEVRGLS